MSATGYKYATRATSQFKKHMKLLKKRSAENTQKMKDTIDLLAKGEKLPKRFRDHELKGEYKGNRECHVAPDLLLIYRIFEEILILELIDTGSHADLFGK